MGAIIAQLDDRTKEDLYNFGLDIGLLFQIQDDIIDETMTEEEAGKTTANDKVKNSFVNLLGLNGAINSADELAIKCEKTLKGFDNNLQNGLNLILKKYLYRHK